MIYRVLQPDLQDLAGEGAYLLMCKAVMPSGMLGLILGGMVFATASSVNTTLNISAGVLTQDVYKRFFPQASSPQLMRFAKLATAVFGGFTLIVALLVPSLGGIVEVVLSLGAITGGAMYLPPIWTLFSRRQTGVSILTTTLLSLGVNAFFKFFAPTLLGISLSRAQEMGLGVALPILLLILWEGYYAALGKASNYQPAAPKSEATNETASTNPQALTKIAWGILAIGTLMTALGAITPKGRLISLAIGGLIIALGLWLRASAQKK